MLTLAGVTAAHHVAVLYREEKLELEVGGA
jgi:hypothetical protein